MAVSVLKDLKLKKDMDGYYLRAVYERTDDYKKTELVIPKIRLPITDYPAIKSEGCMVQYWTANIGFGHMSLGKGIAYPDSAECCYAEKILEEKAHTMTLAEIEKQLGYKINLVAEKEEE